MHTLMDFVTRNVQSGLDTVYTDEHSSYGPVASLLNTNHKTVTHSHWQWAQGEASTNGIEGVWSLLKKSIKGCFHHVSPKHIDRYLEEFEWRYNNRNEPDAFWYTLDRIINTGSYDTFEQLTRDAA